MKYRESQKPVAVQFNTCRKILDALLGPWMFGAASVKFTTYKVYFLFGFFVFIFLGFFVSGFVLVCLSFFNPKGIKSKPQLN